MSNDDYATAVDKYLRRNQNTLLPEEHYKARIRDFVRRAEHAQRPLPMDSGRFFQRKVSEQE